MSSVATDPRLAAHMPATTLAAPVVHIYRRHAPQKAPCPHCGRLGQRTPLLATDPVNDFPVAFAVVGANDQDHMERFLRNLQAHGLAPRAVITDGSNLYPALLAQVWPAAEHQLCVFHVLKDINQ